MRLLHFFRKVRRGRDVVGGLGLLVGALVLLRRGGKIAALQLREQLAFMNLAAAIHVECLHGRADLGDDGRLRQWEQNRPRITVCSMVAFLTGTT